MDYILILHQKINIFYTYHLKGCYRLLLAPKMQGFLNSDFKDQGHSYWGKTVIFGRMWENIYNSRKSLKSKPN